MLNVSIEFISLLLIGMVAGAMMYASHVEIGAREKMSAKEQLANWNYAFPIAGTMFKPLGIFTMILALVSGYILNDSLWYASAFFLFLLTPITLIFIAPINTKLMAADENTSEHEIKNLIAAWAKKHHIRSACSTLAFIIALYASVVN